jgi:hypothetical protein
VFYNEDSICCRLTVPSDFKAPQRDAIKKAAELGGFREVTTIDEPVAAAQIWLRNHSDKTFGNSVVVCDVGGGTTDFAFLRYAEGHFEADEQVLPAGFSEGGNDLDVLIWEKICENNPANGEMDDLVAGFLIKIRRERELSSKTQQEEMRISVKDQECVLTRAIIKDATAEFIDRVKVETKRFLENVQEQVKTDSPPIVLVGGASKLPGLDDALKSLNAGAVYLWNDSDYATVLGAVPLSPIGLVGPRPSPNPRYQGTEKRGDNIDVPPESTDYSTDYDTAEQTYRQAVDACWADKEIQPAEAEYLQKRQTELGISGTKAEEIETAVMGASLGNVLRQQEAKGRRDVVYEHQFNAKEVCLRCGYSKFTIERNGGWKCQPPRIVVKNPLSRQYSVVTEELSWDDLSPEIRAELISDKASSQPVEPQPATRPAQVISPAQTGHKYSNTGFCINCGWEREYLERTGRTCDNSSSQAVVPPSATVPAESGHAEAVQAYSRLQSSDQASSLISPVADPPTGLTTWEGIGCLATVVIFVVCIVGSCTSSEPSGSSESNTDYNGLSRCFAIGLFPFLAWAWRKLTKKSK